MFVTKLYVTKTIACRNLIDNRLNRKTTEYRDEGLMESLENRVCGRDRESRTEKNLIQKIICSVCIECAQRALLHKP